MEAIRIFPVVPEDVDAARDRPAGDAAMECLSLNPDDRFLETPVNDKVWRNPDGLPWPPNTRAYPVLSCVSLHPAIGHKVGLDPRLLALEYLLRTIPIVKRH